MALSLAIEKKKQNNVVGILVQRIARVNFRKDNKNRHDRIAIARALIPKGTNINKRDGPAQRTLASTLFRYNSTIEMLEVLKEAGADFTISSFDNSFLHDMIYIDDSSDVAQLIEFLVNQGRCDVNRPNYRGETALKGAIANAKIDVAKKLIESGAEIHCVDEYDETPFEIACTWDRVDIVNKLTEYGTDLQFRDKNNRTCLHVAAKHGAIRIIKLLIESGADVNAKDSSGKTPLHLAKTDQVVRILFGNGAIVDVLDQDGNTPMHDALSRIDCNTVDELLKCGADIRDHQMFNEYPGAKNDIKVCRIFPSYVKRHFLRLSALGLYDVGPWNLDDDLRMHLSGCQAEAESLKTFFIDNCTSLYGLLRKNRIRRCAHANNEKLTSLVEGGTIQQKFPNYYVLILGSYHEAVSRKSLLEQASRAWLQLTKICLPDLCIDQIFAYLNNKEMLRFIEAHELTR